MALTAAEQKELDTLEYEKLLAESKVASVKDARPLLTKKGLIQGSIAALPVVGATLGGAIGTLGGPAGTIGGAALGGAAGGSLKSFIEGQMGQKKSYRDVAEAPVFGALQGVSGEMGGQLISKAVSKIPSILPKQASKDISAAAQRLGVKATPGMVTQGPTLPGLESSLQQSPTVGGYLVRRNTKPVHEATKKGVEEMLKEASSLSKYEAGSQIKQDLLQNISEKHAPIAQVYDEIQSATKDMVLNPLGQARVAKNIRSIADANLIPGSAEQKMAEQFAQGVESIKSVDQVKMLSSRAKSILRDQTASGPEKQVAAQIVDKLEKYQHNSIMRNAVASARTKSEGTQIAHDIVGDLKEAHAQYRAMLEQLNTLGEGSKLTTGKYGVANITKEIDSVPSEKIPDMLFRTENNDFLKFIKEDYPAIYETAREQKLSDIMKKSMDPQGDISTRKFLQAVKNLGPEVKDHLFGDYSKLSDLKTVVESLPKMIGPSGTPQGLDYQGMLNPIVQGRDMLRYGAYKTLQNTAGVKESLDNPAARALNRYIINKSLPQKSGGSK